MAFPRPSNLSFKVFLVMSSFPHASFLAQSGPEKVVGEVSPFFSLPLLAFAQSRIYLQGFVTAGWQVSPSAHYLSKVTLRVDQSNHAFLSHSLLSTLPQAPTMCWAPGTHTQKRKTHSVLSGGPHSRDKERDQYDAEWYAWWGSDVQLISGRRGRHTTACRRGCMQCAQEEVMLEKDRPQRRGDTFQAGTGQAGCTVHPGTPKQVSIAGSQISR